MAAWGRVLWCRTLANLARIDLLCLMCYHRETPVSHTEVLNQLVLYYKTSAGVSVARGSTLVCLLSACQGTSGRRPICAHANLLGGHLHAHIWTKASLSTLGPGCNTFRKWVRLIASEQT